MIKKENFEKAGFNKSKSESPKENEKDILGILPKERNSPYDMLEIIKRLVDRSEFDEYKEGYGQTILAGYARIDGWAVGIVANQRKLVKTKKGEIQFKKKTMEIQQTKQLALLLIVIRKKYL